MKTWTHDLRFFIGFFFLLVSILLLGQGILAPQMTDGVNLNLYSGAGFMAFAFVALISLALGH